jgi:biopolymer transport protein ExbB/TolQ
MNPANPTVHRPNATQEKPGQGLLSAFVLGLPMAGLIFWAVVYGPFAETTAPRYLHHPVERVEVVMFCCALGALAGKVRQNLRERAALRVKVLHPWDGEVAPVSQASILLHEVRSLPRRLQGTYLVRRVRQVLEFLHSRGSGDELDDQLRSLSDQDAIALEGSNALIRFVTWAIPILGFLGTVLGITGAISGVTPEVLEKSLSTVTDGLALAFDTTALALALTMIAMFCSFLVDRLEQGVLESVDQYVDRELAHRFERSAPAGSSAGSDRNDGQMLTQLCDQVVRRQAEIWGKALLEIDRRRVEADRPQHEALKQALASALESTLESHTRRMEAVEKKSLEQSSQVLQQLADLGDKMMRQAELVASLQEGERQLVRLQETLNRNLEAVAAAGVLQDAVHSLTAAVHLLTARGNAPGGGPRKVA